MNSQEILNYSLAIGFLILVGFISYAAVRLAKSLESLKILIDNLEGTAKDINLIKNKIKIGLLTSLGTILTMLLKKRIKKYS